MTTIGYATLDVVPSMRGLRSELERQSSSDMTAAGRTSGQRFGNAAGQSAGTGFKSKVGTALKGFNPLAGLAIGASVATFLKGSLDEAREAAIVAQQTAAVIKSTGGAAQVSAAQVADLSGALSEKVGIDDEAIQSGANLLLTFKNIKNEAGSGNDIFDQATQTILDMSTAMGTDLKGSAIQLGKALNDPVKGLSALSRVGVTFTDAQKTTVKAMVEAGDAMGAQKIILAELASEFGGAAVAGHDAGDKLAVAFGNLQEAVGTQLLPVFNSISTFVATKGIPALTAFGGAVGNVATWFGKLPGPIKTAVGAFVALRIAAALSLGTTFAAMMTRASAALIGFYLRIGTAVQTFNAARISSGLFAASLGAIKSAALFAGAALKSAFIAAGPLVAIVAITTAIGHFWAEQQKAKQHIEDMTAALDEQTGALTGTARELAYSALKDADVIDIAKQYGISLKDLTGAALGLEGPSARVNAVLDEQVSAFQATAAEQRRLSGGYNDVSDSQLAALGPVHKLREAIFAETGTVADARVGWQDHKDAMGGNTAVADKVKGAIQDLGAEVDQTRKAIRKLIAAEDARKSAFGERITNELDLIDAIQAGRVMSNHGIDSMDKYTKAGKRHWRQLLEIKDVWNDLPKRMQNSEGAYEEMRRKYIKIAVAMGDTRKHAKYLADQILEIPKTAPLKFQSEGYKEQMAKIAEVKRALKAAKDMAMLVNFNPSINKPRPEQRAYGGLIGGRGTGTSDSNLILASRGEFMQREAAVKHYGLDFMRQVNNLSLPKFAGGGAVSGGGSGSGVSFTGPISVVAHDYRDFMGQLDRKARQAALGGMPA